MKLKWQMNPKFKEKLKKLNPNFQRKQKYEWTSNLKRTRNHTTNKPQILEESQSMNEPQNLKEHQISKETHITNEPQIMNDPQILKEC